MLNRVDTSEQSDDFGFWKAMRRFARPVRRGAIEADAFEASVLDSRLTHRT